jgi:hypothetical protein
VDYTTVSLAEVCSGLEAVSADVDATFGRLDAGRLNWKPDATQWRVAQCFDHLLTANTRWLPTVGAERERRIMTSPFVSFITDSLLDGARLMLAHDHRHIEQARRVTHARGFA